MLDVYLPKGDAPAGGRPVLIAIHGGGWRRLSSEGYGRAISSLTSAGYAVVAPSYTLSDPGAPSWPFALNDVRESVRWVRRNAATWGFDPDRVAAIGESAGGHLAALLATADDVLAPDGVSSKVDAAVSFYGPTDLVNLYRVSRMSRPAVAEFLGGSPDRYPGRYATASPLMQVSPGDAPILLVHGRTDRLVPVAQSRALANALSRAGVRQRLIVLPRAGHGFRLKVGGRDLSPDVLEFLAQAWENPMSPS